MKERYKFRPTRIHKYPTADLEECYDVESWDDVEGRAVLRVKGQLVTVDTSDVASCGVIPDPLIETIKPGITRRR